MASTPRGVKVHDMQRGKRVDESRWSDLTRSEKAGELLPVEIIPMNREARRRTGYDTAVSLSDIHFPFHDAVVLAQVERLLAVLQPDIIYLNGDIIDCVGLSRWNKDPNRRELLQDELKIAQAFFARLRIACPNARIYFIIGNHEERVEVALWGTQYARDLASLECLKLQELLKLSNYEIEMAPTDGINVNGVFQVTHGTVIRKHGGDSARGEHEKWGYSGVSGHTHRAARYEIRKASGEFVWTEQGCLCDLSPRYIKGVANWQHAFNIMRFSRSSRRFQSELVRIADHKLIYGGVDYS